MKLATTMTLRYLAAALLASLLPMCVYADDDTGGNEDAVELTRFTATNADGVELHYIITSEEPPTVSIESATTVPEVLNIPATVVHDDVRYTVTTVADYAFMGATALKQVNFPSTIVLIGDSAFNGSGLTSVTIPDSVTTIEANAFGGCQSLLTVVIGDGVKVIPSTCFANCWSLKNVTIGTNVIEIGKGAFYADTDDRTIVSEAVTPPTIEEGAFMAVPSKARVYVPSESVEAYKAATGWSKFGDNIQAIVVTGLESLSADGSAVVEGDVLRLPAAASVAIYSLDGRLLGTAYGDAVTLPAERGVMVAVIGGRAVKLAR